MENRLYASVYVCVYAHAVRAYARAACERGSAVYINFARACPDLASAYPPITHVHGITRGQDFCLSRVYNESTRVDDVSGAVRMRVEINERSLRKR